MPCSAWPCDTGRPFQRRGDGQAVGGEPSVGATPSPGGGRLLAAVPDGSILQGPAAEQLKRLHA